MPINPAREQVQGTGTNLTASVQSGQQIASQQISDSFNYGEEARELRQRAMQMQEASTVNNIIVSQGELELQKQRNPSAIALAEAQARSANVQADLTQREVDLSDDEWRARYNSTTRLAEAQAATMNRSAEGKAIENEEASEMLKAKKQQGLGYFDRLARADIREKEAKAKEAEATADKEASLAAGTPKEVEFKNRKSEQEINIKTPEEEGAIIKAQAIENSRPEIAVSEAKKIEDEVEETWRSREAKKKEKKQKEEEERRKEIKDAAQVVRDLSRQKGDMAEIAMLQRQISKTPEGPEKRQLEARLEALTAGVNIEDFSKILGMMRGESSSTTTTTGTKTATEMGTSIDAPTPTATPTATATPSSKTARQLYEERIRNKKQSAPKASDLINKTAAGEPINPEDQPIKKIANSLLEAPNSQVPEGGTIASLRDQNKRVRKEYQMNVASQANLLVNSAIRKDTESDIDNEASIESIRLIDPNAYAARQKRAAEIGLFQQASGVNQLDSQLVSTALNFARENRAGKREVSQLNRQYAKELQTGGIVDGILDVVDEADPRIIADFVGNVPDDREVRKGLGIQYFSSLQGKIAETGDPAIKAPLRRELAKQALVVMPEAVKQVASFWNSGDLINKDLIAANAFGKEVPQLDPQERAELNSMVTKRVAFQQAAKKMGLGSGKLEDVFTVSGHDLDYYPQNDPIRAAAERALIRMGEGADDGVFIMKRHGSGYHAAFAPANDPELSRQALSVQDAMFHYRTALHDGDEADILESVGITTDTLNRFGPEETKSLSLLYGLFPYKEALPGLIKAINGYREKRLSLGDGHELRNDFESQVADVIMYQTKPGLEYNDPNKKGAIMRRVREVASQSFLDIEAPMDRFGRTTKPVSQRVRERLTQA